MTRITINLPLVDERACFRCRFLDRDVCEAFTLHQRPRQLTEWVKITVGRHERTSWKRLPECIAATVEEVARG